MTPIPTAVATAISIRTFSTLLRPFATFRPIPAFLSVGRTVSAFHHLLPLNNRSGGSSFPFGTRPSIIPFSAAPTASTTATRLLKAGIAITITKGGSQTLRGSRGVKSFFACARLCFTSIFGIT